MIGVTALVLLLTASGCEMLGYDDYVGTWAYSYETVDALGNPVTGEQQLQLETDAFTLRDIDGDSGSWLGARGDLLVVGNTFYFTTSEVGMDASLRTSVQSVFASESVTFGLPDQDWYEIDVFFDEMAKLSTPLFDRDFFELGTTTVTIRGDTLELASDPDNPFTKQE
jgi:hypothetical protein